MTTDKKNQAIPPEIVAAIAMALNTGQSVHDYESYRITIVRKASDWNSKILTMRNRPQ